MRVKFAAGLKSVEVVAEAWSRDKKMKLNQLITKTPTCLWFVAFLFCIIKNSMFSALGCYVDRTEMEALSPLNSCKLSENEWIKLNPSPAERVNFWSAYPAAGTDSVCFFSGEWGDWQTRHQRGRRSSISAPYRNIGHLNEEIDLSLLRVLVLFSRFSVSCSPCLFLMS